MARVKRFLCSVGFCLFASSPLTALAASPSPSPGVDQLLAPPPSGYAELTTASLHGQFTAHDWAANATGASTAETENTLNTNGFVGGYGKEWSSGSLRRSLIEAVMAFTGGRGANNILTALEKTDKADAAYKSADTTTGLGTYYGGHFTANGAYVDEFVFTKGNDLFIVIVAGATDNVMSAAADQAKAQYDAAPAESIPSSQWPENQSTNSGTGPFTYIGIGAVVFVVAIVAAALRRRRSAARLATATYAPPPMSGPVQMSPDGNFWWDGQAWRDASHEAPPAAQRSADGSLWWDGKAWRPIPQSVQPPPG